jgi:2-polyprenyl-6-methoxyphenol hydroxylase-like FAD-dependent oxidoreductase
MLDVDDEFDIVVVGARVAGSTLAALVGDAGYRVLVVDRAAFPSPTLSTHFFRGGGLVSVLARLGLLDSVLALGTPRLTCQYVYAEGEAEPTREPAQLPGVAGYCLSVRREPLDALLVERAQASPSVRVLPRTRVVGLLWDEQRVCGVQLATPAGSRTVRARLIVGADGRHSVVAQAVGAPLEASAPPFRVAYYCYLTAFPNPGGVEPDGPEFSHFEGEIAYAFPSDGGMTCVALSLDIAEFATMRAATLDDFHRRVTRHPAFSARQAAWQPTSRLFSLGPQQHNYVHVPRGPGWALVGDAGLYQDPWSGQGMDMAGVHATFLAESLLDWLRGTRSEEDALAHYHERRNAHGLPAYHATLALAPAPTPAPDPGDAQE